MCNQRSADVYEKFEFYELNLWSCLRHWGCVDTEAKNNCDSNATNTTGGVPVTDTVVTALTKAKGGDGSPADARGRLAYSAVGRLSSTFASALLMAGRVDASEKSAPMH